MKNCVVEEIIESVLKKIRVYCHDVEQTDDITMLAIRFKGP